MTRQGGLAWHEGWGGGGCVHDRRDAWQRETATETGDTHPT